MFGGDFWNLFNEAVVEWVPLARKLKTCAVQRLIQEEILYLYITHGELEH